MTQPEPTVWTRERAGPINPRLLASIEQRIGGETYKARAPTGDPDTDWDNLNRLFRYVESKPWWSRSVLQPGQYQVEKSVIFPQASIIDAAGPLETQIIAGPSLSSKWGEYVMRPDPIDYGIYPSLIQNINILGTPQGSRVNGQPPSAVNGIYLSGRSILLNSTVNYCYGGACTQDDHTKVILSGLSNNYFGFYQPPAPFTIGNHSIIASELTGNWMASLGTSRQASLAGIALPGTHLGYAPHIFYRQSGTPGPLGGTFIGGSFGTNALWMEAIGNSVAWDENQPLGATDSNITDVDWGEWSLSIRNSEFGITGQKICLLHVGQLNGCSFGPWSQGDTGLGVVTDALFDLNVNQVSQDCHFRGVPLPTGTGPGQRIFPNWATGSGDFRTSTYAGSKYGDKLTTGRILWCSTAVALGDLLRRNGRDGAEAWTSGAVPAGFALHPSLAGEFVVVADDGYVNAARASGTVGAGKFCKADDANPGKVLQATGPTDGTKVGVSLTGATNANFSIEASLP